MPDSWYTLLSTVCVRAYFTRIQLIGRERLPKAGPILYVGLHRNGAVDGFVYKSTDCSATPEEQNVFHRDSRRPR